MTSVQEHRNSVRELVNEIMEKLRSGLLVERQKVIGFSASEAACDLFALVLHRRGLIDPGFNVNHRFFASAKMAEERFPFAFPEKAKLLPLLMEQERFRSLLCYGKAKDEATVRTAIDNLFAIKRMVEAALGEEV